MTSEGVSSRVNCGMAHCVGSACDDGCLFHVLHLSSRPCCGLELDPLELSAAVPKDAESISVPLKIGSRTKSISAALTTTLASGCCNSGVPWRRITSAGSWSSCENGLFLRGGAVADEEDEEAFGYVQSRPLLKHRLQIG